MLFKLNYKTVEVKVAIAIDKLGLTGKELRTLQENCAPWACSSMGAAFIDTAERYGTEEVVGNAIQGIREKVFVATRASPRHFRQKDLIEAADLTRLHTDYIDLYQLPWPNYSVPIEETMAAVEHKQRKLCRLCRW